MHNTKFISYGVITKVLDTQNVNVAEIVQTSLSDSIYTVTLLCPSSSAFEMYTAPNVGDLVLLLYLQNYDPVMFDGKPIYRPYADGYNNFSGVGILMSPPKARSSTTIWNNADSCNITSIAKIYAELDDLVNLTFGGGEGTPVNPVNVLFDISRPYKEEHWDRTTRIYDDAVTEEYSEDAPIEKDIQGTQEYTVGDTIDAELSAQADVTITSAAGITLHFDKAIAVSSGDGFDLTITGPVTLHSDDKITLDATGDVDIQAGGNVSIKATGNADIEATGNATVKGSLVTLDSTAPVVINTGLLSSALGPYFGVEVTAETAIQSAAQAAVNGLPSSLLMTLDSAGTGLILALATALVTSSGAMLGADGTVVTALGTIVA
jgi:hypothetical protein